MPDIRDEWSAAVLRDHTLGAVRVTCFAIRQYADRRGRATVGITTLADDTCTEPRTVERHLATLVTRGYVKRTPGAGITGRGGTTTLTELVLPAMAPPEKRRRGDSSTDNLVGVSTDKPVGASGQQSTDNSGTKVPTTQVLSTDRALSDEPLRNHKSNHNSEQTKSWWSVIPKFQQEVIELYHEMLPNHPRVSDWGPETVAIFDRVVAHRQAIGKKADTIGYWRKVFEIVNANPFLSGRSGEKKRRNVGSLKWLLRKPTDEGENDSNLIDVFEGKYG